MKALRFSPPDRGAGRYYGCFDSHNPAKRVGIIVAGRSNRRQFFGSVQILVDRPAIEAKDSGVNRAAISLAGASDSTAPANSPDWGMVPFAVGCARCGHDLRGQTAPICPHCELTFDWADAVPIERVTCVHCDYHLYGLQETRCPECGIEFTWDEALAEYHRRRLPWFEYRWRDQPIRSVLTTWRGALHPGTFWRSIDIHPE